MLVTVFTSDEQAIAHLVAGHLQGLGIQAFVNDENLVMVDNLYGPAVAGVKVQVLPREAERARQVIDEELTEFVTRSSAATERSADAATLPDDDAPDFEAEEPLRCDCCCSEQLIAYRPWAWLALLFPPLFILGSMKRYRCMDCGHVQKEEEI